MARGVCSVSAWHSRSVHVVQVVANQEHSDCAVPTVQVPDGTGMEICNANCACAKRWIGTIQRVAHAHCVFRILPNTAVM